jgi:hypothetical protein
MRNDSRKMKVWERTGHLKETVMKTQMLGMTVTKRDETKGGPAYLLSSHCGAAYALYRLEGADGILMAAQVNPGRFPILNVRTDRFTDRDGVLKIVGR